MATFKDLSRRTIEDLRSGRHREAYALFLIGVTLAVLGLVGVADITVLLSAILLALSFLVFHTATEASGQRLDLDEVLRSREDYGPFSKLLQGVHDLRIYGPTAVNVAIQPESVSRAFIADARDCPLTWGALVGGCAWWGAAARCGAMGARLRAGARGRR